MAARSRDRPDGSWRSLAMPGAPIGGRKVGQDTLVKPGARISLNDYDPGFCSGYHKRDTAVVDRLAADLETMRELQERLYAEGKQALLIVLQGMDASGKDGTVRHVMSGLNPQSCYVVSFKVPTPEELSHDFLWRIHRRTPGKGEIAVFNRSHYEDVVAVRVRGLLSEKECRRRYDQINYFEQHLVANGTRVVKLFLHISADEQKQRLEARLRDPTKQWKFRPGDLDDRARWNDYMRAYEDAIAACSTDLAPWYIIPANRKWYRNLVVAQIVAATLHEMDPQWPKPRADLSSLVIS